MTAAQAVFLRPLHGQLFGRTVWETRKSLPEPTSGSPTCTVSLTLNGEREAEKLNPFCRSCHDHPSLTRFRAICILPA